MLIRIVSMLTKLGRRGHEQREKETLYGDYDDDNDNEEDESRVDASTHLK